MSFRTVKDPRKPSGYSKSVLFLKKKKKKKTDGAFTAVTWDAAV